MTMGEPAVVEACRAMLRGDDAPLEAVLALGGRNAAAFLDELPGSYWGRCWGARGLLYVWGDAAIPSLREAITDECWRVREMVAKVVAKRRLDELAGPVATLRTDEVARVRAAAQRALERLATGTA